MPAHAKQDFVNVKALCLAIFSLRSRVSERRGKLTNVPAQCSNDNFRVFARHLDQHGKARMTFYQGRNVTVLGAAQQITFPVARNRSVFHFRRPFADRDGIDDLTPGLSAGRCMSRAAHAPLRSQVVDHLFFQYSPRLDEQAAVDGLVRHSHALVIGILSLQPSGNLFRRPVQHQFTSNHVPQLAVHGKKTPFRSQR